MEDQWPPRNVSAKKFKLTYNGLLREEKGNQKASLYFWGQLFTAGLALTLGPVAQKSVSLTSWVNVEFLSKFSQHLVYKLRNISSQIFSGSMVALRTDVLK